MVGVQGHKNAINDFVGGNKQIYQKYLFVKGQTILNANYESTYQYKMVRKFSRLIA